MTRKTFSTDGFVIPRRPRPESRARLDNVNHLSPAASAQPQSPALNRHVHTDSGATLLPPLEIPESSKDQKLRKKRFGLRKPSRKTVKWTFITLGVLLLIGAGYFAYKFIITGSQIFKGNPLNAFLAQGKELKMDTSGRTNILMFGTSEDDPSHPGADLTDSIMVVSVDQKKKDAFLVSIPRDLGVQYGRACISGYSGKVNVIYQCVKDSGEDAAQQALRQKIGEVLGLDLQYAVHVNYTALRQTVDAVGGITVHIESTNPAGVLDRNFDWKCKYKCYYVKWPNGPAQLDGEHALALARARGDVPPTYGFERSNFEREQYQQKIIIALKDKASSAGTLANPVAVNNLLSALGSNVRTNFEAEEIKTLVQLGKDIKSEDIKRLDLYKGDTVLFKSGNDGNVYPAAGMYNYSAVAKVVKAYASGDVAYLENATIVILNASGQPGAAQTKAEELKKDGLTIKSTGNAPETLGSTPLQLFDQSEGKKPETLKKLEKVLNLKASTTIPAGVGSDADFIIIVGASTDASEQ